MEGFQGIAAWDLKYRFARDLNLLKSLTALIGGEGIVGIRTVNPKTAPVLSGFGQRQP